MTSHAAMLIASQYCQDHIPDPGYDFASPDDELLCQVITGRMTRNERRMVKKATRRKVEQVESQQH
jgi:hypothetical protein